MKSYKRMRKCMRSTEYLHKLDNKTSHDVESFIKENNTKLQYTPPDIPRTNPADRSIRTWKNHFVAIRAGAPKTYRLSNWCKDLEQPDITLNMLRPCTTNPKLSAYKAMEGMYLFDATLMAPTGTECMIHIKPTRRQTWGYHAMKAWYFAPTHSKFLHHTLPTPVISNTDRIVKATQQLKLAIEGTQNADKDELTAIQHLQALITGATNTTIMDKPPVDTNHEPELPAFEHVQVSTQVPIPVQLKPQPSPEITDTPGPIPHHIPYNDNEYEQPPNATRRYNLRTRVVDDFGIKSVGLCHAKHLKTALEKVYKV
ncbi:hypothetical protein ACHAW6_002832 [Cyclotella cf. meneghiniana]